MANVKISDMTRATSVGGSDLLPIVQGGESKSIEYKNMNKYSTSEQVVGTWIDGKPLYRCVIQMTVPTVSTEDTGVPGSIDISSLSVDSFFVEFAYVYNSQDNSMYPCPVFRGQKLVARVLANATNLYIWNYTVSYSGLKCIVSLLYTKTTDSAS